jgi:hypothetical protein
MFCVHLSYLILKNGLSPADAVEAVKDLRPAGIYDPACFSVLKAVMPPSVSPPAWDTRTSDQRAAWCVITEPYPTCLVTGVDCDSGAVKLCVDGSGWVVAAPKPFAAPLLPPVKRARVDRAPTPPVDVPDPAVHIEQPALPFTHPFAFASKVVPASPLYDWVTTTLCRTLTLTCSPAEVIRALIDPPVRVLIRRMFPYHSDVKFTRTDDVIRYAQVKFDASKHLKPELRDGTVHILTWSPVGDAFTSLLTAQGVFFITPSSMWLYQCELPSTLHRTVAQGVAVIETLPDGSKVHRILMDDALVVAVGTCALTSVQIDPFPLSMLLSPGQGVNDSPLVWKVRISARSRPDTTQAGHAAE